MPLSTAFVMCEPVNVMNPLIVSCLSLILAPDVCSLCLFQNPHCVSGSESVLAGLYLLASVIATVADRHSYFGLSECFDFSSISHSRLDSIKSSTIWYLPQAALWSFPTSVVLYHGVAILFVWPTQTKLHTRVCTSGCYILPLSHFLLFCA